MSAADPADAALRQERNTIVDLGCGTGTLTELLARRGYDMIGIDSSEEMLQIALDETQRRREMQEQYNKEHGITPQTIKKAVRDLISISKSIAKEELRMEKDPESMSRDELEKLIADVQKQMKKAAAELNFEAAAELRDRMIELKKHLQELD